MDQQIKADDKVIHLVTITVNNKPVEVEGPRISGVAIKESAIAQGVEIELDFQLAEIKNKKRQIIGDQDIVTVNKNSTFVATAADDNS
jgi:Multiubiquitin